MLQKNLKSSLKNLYTLPCCDDGDCFTVYLQNIDCYEIESPRYAAAVPLSDSDCKTLLEAYERHKGDIKMKATTVLNQKQMKGCEI